MIYKKIIKIRNYCIKKNISLAFCESVTGGMLSNYFTNIKGASNFFRGSLILYHISAKQQVLDETITNPNNFNQLQIIAVRGKELLGSEVIIAVSGYASKDSLNNCYANIVIIINDMVYKYHLPLYFSFRKLNKYIICNRIVGILYDILLKQK